MFNDITEEWQIAFWLNLKKKKTTSLAASKISFYKDFGSCIIIFLPTSEFW